jgi:hypothetical protein
MSRRITRGCGASRHGMSSASCPSAAASGRNRATPAAPPSCGEDPHRLRPPARRIRRRSSHHVLFSPDPVYRREKPLSGTRRSGERFDRTFSINSVACPLRVIGAPHSLRRGRRPRSADLSFHAAVSGLRKRAILGASAFLSIGRSGQPSPKPCHVRDTRAAPAHRLRAAHRIGHPVAACPRDCVRCRRPIGRVGRTPHQAGARDSPTASDAGSTAAGHRCSCRSRHELVMDGRLGRRWSLL